MSAAIDALRTALVALKHSGDDSFEQLMAVALSEAGHSYLRLASAGRQLGRDGATSPGPFDVLFEAKRYDDDSPSASALLEKLSAAIIYSPTRLDLWVLTSTVSIPALAVEQLVAAGDTSGVCVLVLDWSTDLLPPLAILLASAESKVLEWFTRVSPADVPVVTSALNEVKSDPAYSRGKEALIGELRGTSVGLGAARAKNRLWLNETLANRLTSKSVFGQFIVPLAPDRPRVPRTAATNLKNALQSGHQSQARLIVVLGDEGVGKTWIVTEAWEELPEETRPILLLNTTRDLPTAEDLREPIRFLARLLIKQTGASYENTEKWVKRLSNWKKSNPADSHPRIILALDGLNERETFQWVTLIDELSTLPAGLGVQVVITSRTGFYRNELAPKLGHLHPHEVPVRDFDQVEQKSAFEKRGVDINRFTREQLSYLVNPRVFSIAVDLLDHLDPAHLTKDRLFLEYLKSRSAEHGDRARHTDEEVKELLGSHARSLRAKISENPLIKHLVFDRFKISAHSRRATGRSDSSIDDELNEIESGRFFRESATTPGHYEFREGAADFALGIMFIDGIKQELAKDASLEPLTAISVAVEPVHGLDLTADTLLSALAVACLDNTCSDKFVSGLLYVVATLQNLNDSAFSRFSAYAPDRMTAYIEATELFFSTGTATHHRRDWMEECLFVNRLTVRSADAIDRAIKRWLGLWCLLDDPALNRHGNDPVAAAEKRVAYTDQRFAILTGEERSHLDAHGVRTEDASLPDIDRVAVKLMIGKAIAPFAPSIFCWCLATAVMYRLSRANDLMPWVVQFNRVDFEAAADALAGAIDKIVHETTSETGLVAAYRGYRLTGRPSDAEKSEKVEERLPDRPGFRWHIKEDFFPADPIDPTSTQDDFTNAIRALERITPGKTAASFSVTEEDRNLKMLTPGFSRFLPDPLVEKIREIARSGKDRSGMDLRQLSLKLPEWSPLFRQEEVSALVEAYEQAVTSITSFQQSDKLVVPSFILASLLPHLDSKEQLTLLLKLPSDVTELLLFRDHFKPMSALDFEEFLVSAYQSGNPAHIRRTLYFGTRGTCPLTATSRELLINCLASEDQMVRVTAIWTASSLNDDEALAAHFDSPWTSENANGVEPFYGSRALVLGCSDRANIAVMKRLSAEWLGTASLRLGPKFTEVFVNVVTKALSDGLKTPIELPTDYAITRNDEHTSAPDETAPVLRIDRTTEEPRDAMAALQKMSRPATEILSASEDEWNREREILDNVVAAMKAADISEVLQSGRTNEIEVIRLLFPKAFEVLVVALEEADDRSLYRVHPLATCIATVLGDTEPERAIKLFKRLQGSRAIINIVFGPTKLPFVQLAPWHCAESKPMSEFLKSQFLELRTDAEISTEVRCAISANKAHLVSELVADLRASNHPVDLALAATIARFSTGIEFDQVSADARYKSGFLQTVFAAAKHDFERYRWSEFWFAKIVAASDPVEFWRYLSLTGMAVDARYMTWELEPTGHSTQPYRIFEETFRKAAKSTAEAKEKKREDTLYGRKIPDRDFIAALLTITP